MIHHQSLQPYGSDWWHHMTHNVMHRHFVMTKQGVMEKSREIRVYVDLLTVNHYKTLCKKMNMHARAYVKVLFALNKGALNEIFVYVVFSRSE